MSGHVARIQARGGCTRRAKVIGPQVPRTRDRAAEHEARWVEALDPWRKELAERAAEAAEYLRRASIAVACSACDLDDIRSVAPVRGAQTAARQRLLHPSAAERDEIEPALRWHARVRLNDPPALEERRS